MPACLITVKVKLQNNFSTHVESLPKTQGLYPKHIHTQLTVYWLSRCNQEARSAESPKERRKSCADISNVKFLVGRKPYGNFGEQELEVLQGQLPTSVLEPSCF